MYKWQSLLGDHNDELDDTIMDETPEEAIGARMLGLVDNNPQPSPPVNPNVRNSGRPRPPNRIPDRPDYRRVSYQEPPEYRTLNNMRYNVPIYNRFSPLRNQQGPYSPYRRDFREERDFPRERQRDRPPGRWKACALYRVHGWRGQNGNRWHSERRPTENWGRPNPNHELGIWREDKPQLWPGLQSRKGLKRHRRNTKEPGKKKQTRGCRGGRKKKKKSALGKGIYNLSNATFTDEEHQVLNLGLKFAPDRTLDTFEAYIDLQKFMRKLNLKKTLRHEYR